MTEFKTIAIAKILVPERLRAVEDDHALAIQASVVEHGLINPITVRSTPRAKLPYTLVAGAHRLRAYELAQDDWSTEIECLVVEADKDEAALVEISENLFRNELSALDRAMFVMSYREIWERKHGKIARGGDQSANSALRSNPLSIIEDEAASGFSVHVADRLGVSKRTVMYAQAIAQKLSPELRRGLRGTADADNQSLLLKLAGMPAERQHLVATSYSTDRDMRRALELSDPNAKAQSTKSAQDELLERLVSTWARADEKTRAAFLKHAGVEAKKPHERRVLPAQPIDEASPADPDQITVFDILRKAEVL